MGSSVCKILSLSSVSSNTDLTYIDIATDPPFGLNLTAEQKRLVWLHWRDDYIFLNDLGSSVYRHIFANAPEAKNLFRRPTVDVEVPWEESSTFHAQSLRFVQIISSVVRNLNSPAVTDSLLRRVGARHVKYISRGFQPAYWGVFKGAIDTAIREQMTKEAGYDRNELEDLLDIWTILADYIINRMEEGFRSALQG